MTAVYAVPRDAFGQEGRALEFEAVRAQCRQLSRRTSSQNVGIKFME
jgi:hypothetical protein